MRRVGVGGSRLSWDLLTVKTAQLSPRQARRSSSGFAEPPVAQAILLGWATAVPVLVEITELPPLPRPTSEDPRFWDVWTGAQDRTIDWAAVADDWTRTF